MCKLILQVLNKFFPSYQSTLSDLSVGGMHSGRRNSTNNISVGASYYLFTVWLHSIQLSEKRFFPLCPGHFAHAFFAVSIFSSSSFCHWQQIPSVWMCSKTDACVIIPRDGQKVRWNPPVDTKPTHSRSLKFPHLEPQLSGHPSVVASLWTMDRIISKYDLSTLHATSPIPTPYLQRMAHESGGVAKVTAKSTQNNVSWFDCLVNQPTKHPC